MSDDKIGRLSVAFNLSDGAIALLRDIDNPRSKIYAQMRDDIADMIRRRMRQHVDKMFAEYVGAYGYPEGWPDESR